MGEFHRRGLIALGRDLPTEEHAGAPGEITGDVLRATPERPHRLSVAASQSPDEWSDQRILSGMYFMSYQIVGRIAASRRTDDVATGF